MNRCPHNAKPKAVSLLVRAFGPHMVGNTRDTQTHTHTTFYFFLSMTDIEKKKTFRANNFPKSPAL